MRVLVLVKASPESETGQMPPDFKDFVDQMNKFNEELTRAGVMLAADGLYPSSKGKRVRFDGTKRSVIDGPFAETKEQLGGFYLISANDLNEALQVASKIPSARFGSIEVRPIIDYSQPV